jgi:transcriptional regulator with XRE-family HTH domain
MASDVCILLGKRIRKLRQERGWRQLDLAEQAGLNENYISDLELGRKEACLRTLSTLSQAFEMKLADLLQGVD